VPHRGIPIIKTFLSTFNSRYPGNKISSSHRKIQDVKIEVVSIGSTIKMNRILFNEGNLILPGSKEME
jgi:hypothetical protein